MSSKKIYLLILVFSIIYLCDYGQQINYSNLISYNQSNTLFKVAGKVGNNIHIWKFLVFPDAAAKEKSPISILIFSDQMKLITEIPTKMMDETIFGIDEYFQVVGNIYYAYIKYFTADYVVKRQVFKIDENGNAISTSLYIDAPENPGPLYVSEKFPYVRNNSTEYYASTGSLISDSALIKKSSPEKKTDPEIKNLSIFKKDLTPGNPSSQIQFSSTIFNFTNPRLALDKDKAIWVCASNKLNPEIKHKDSSVLYSFFIARVDSNLREISSDGKFLKINSPNLANNIFYRIERAFAINKNLFLLTFGNELTKSYSDNSYVFQNLPGQRYLPPVREEHQIYEIKSLRIFQIDESNKCIMDKIISTNLFKAKLSTENSFYSTNTSGIDLLFQQQFPHKSNGILHIAVSNNTITQSDIPVNPTYDYMLSNAKKINETTYIIPFLYHSEIGFIKWVNTNQSN